MPVIKADAYGHGLAPTAEMLRKEGADLLAVGLPREGESLRRSGFSGTIVCLMGATSPTEAEICWLHDLVPLVHERGSIRRLTDTRPAGGRLRVGIKFDTGMSRLGFRREEAEDMAGMLKKASGISPWMLFSHLATADDPTDAAFVAEQVATFRSLHAFFDDQGLRLRASLANSGALLAYPEAHFDIQRPGISLYGTNPFAGTALESLGRGLAPAMEVCAPVISVHDLRRGESVSYGRTFTAEHDMRVAVVGIGYADNYSRAFSGRGFMVLRGRRVPILGRVCMQMTVVDVTAAPDVVAGDTAWVLGGPDKAAVIPAELSAWSGTIDYEIFCLLGQNPRVHFAEADSKAVVVL